MKTYVIASTVIFNEAGKILILKRSDNDTTRPGEPDLPGGEAEEHETPFVAACRELLEETGINFGLQDIWLVFGWSTVKYHTEEKTEVNFVYTNFLAEMPTDQEIKLSHEHQSFNWQTLDQAIAGFADRPSKKNFLLYLRENNIEPRLTHGKVI